MEHNMVSELRWTLLVVGAVFIGVLAWWERRRPRQAAGAPERAATPERTAAREPAGEASAAARVAPEPTLTLPHIHAGEPLGSREAIAAREAPGTRDLPVVELPVVDLPALGLSTDADSSPLPVLEPATSGVAAAVAAGGGGLPDAVPALDAPTAAPPPPAAATPEGDSPGGPRDVLPELPIADPPRVDWPPGDQRRIVALRLVAPLPERFPGRSLRQALAAEGFVLGRFAIFHKPDEEQRAVLSAASLTRPGTFDMQTMDSQRYGGLSLFAVLPGPKPPPQAFDELVFTARNLNERLHGVLQDEAGGPLTQARIAQLREQLHFGAAS